MASSPRVEELRKKFDENPRRYFAPLANEYRKAGDFAQAIAICREYLPQQPGHMSGHIVFGQALYEARQFDEAKTVFETALSLDPENLIALKHLGDIELIAGKTEAARAWYQKILDADPRNEEILAQLAKLEQKKAGAKVGATMVMQAVPRPGTAPKTPTPTPAAATPAQAAAPTPPSQSAPTPVVTPAVPKPEPPEAPAPPAPAAAAVVTEQSPTQEIRLDTITTHTPPAAPSSVEPALGLEPTSMGEGIQPQSFSTAPTIEIDAHVSAPKEAPPTESFSLEGLETTSLTADAPAAAAPAPEPAPAAPPPPAPEAPAEGLVDLDLSIPSAETPPPPPVATAPAEKVDLDFGAPPPPPPTPASIADAAPAETIDLDFAPPAAPPAEAPPPAPEPVAASAADDLPLLDIGSESLAPPPVTTPTAPAPEAVAAAAPDTSSAFVTETMAELYLKQGHRDEALRVYRALIEKRPGDAGLLAKIESLMPKATPAPRTGPSIRELLSVIAQRRPGYRAAPPSNGNGTAADAAAALGADALASIIGAQPSAADEAAAMVLATAFIAQGRGDSILGGAPAHPASSDLSLNTVFSAGNPAPAAASPNFSFDQFFSQRATADHGVPAIPEEHSESKEDVAQFSQWLEGLKQK